LGLSSPSIAWRHAGPGAKAAAAIPLQGVRGDWAVLGKEWPVAEARSITEMMASSCFIHIFWGGLVAMPDQTPHKSMRNPSSIHPVARLAGHR